jgi:hypothetical protein
MTLTYPSSDTETIDQPLIFSEIQKEIASAPPIINDEPEPQPTIQKEKRFGNFFGQGKYFPNTYKLDTFDDEIKSGRNLKLEWENACSLVGNENKSVIVKGLKSVFKKDKELEGLFQNFILFNRRGILITDEIIFKHISAEFLCRFIKEDVIFNRDTRGRMICRIASNLEKDDLVNHIKDKLAKDLKLRERFFEKARKNLKIDTDFLLELADKDELCTFIYENFYFPTLNIGNICEDGMRTLEDIKKALLELFKLYPELEVEFQKYYVKTKLNMEMTDNLIIFSTAEEVICKFFNDKEWFFTDAERKEICKRASDLTEKKELVKYVKKIINSNIELYEEFIEYAKKSLKLDIKSLMRKANDGDICEFINIYVNPINSPEEKMTWRGYSRSRYSKKPYVPLYPDLPSSSRSLFVNPYRESRTSSEVYYIEPISETKSQGVQIESSMDLPKTLEAMKAVSSKSSESTESDVSSPSEIKGGYRVKKVLKTGKELSPLDEQEVPDYEDLLGYNLNDSPYRRYYPFTFNGLPTGRFRRIRWPTKQSVSRRYFDREYDPYSGRKIPCRTYERFPDYESQKYRPYYLPSPYDPFFSSSYPRLRGKSFRFDEKRHAFTEEGEPVYLANNFEIFPEDYQEWLMDPSINPISGAKISKDGSVFKSFKSAGEFFKNSRRLL